MSRLPFCAQNRPPRSEGKTGRGPDGAGTSPISLTIMLRSLLELNDYDLKIKHTHDLENVGTFNCSIMTDDVIVVQVGKLIRMGRRIDKNVEFQPCRLPKVIT